MPGGLALGTWATGPPRGQSIIAYEGWLWLESKKYVYVCVGKRWVGVAVAVPSHVTRGGENVQSFDPIPGEPSRPQLLTSRFCLAGRARQPGPRQAWGEGRRC